MKLPPHKRIDPSRLVIKKSTLPGAGKGLFTRQPISRGELVVEYKGLITTWKKIKDSELFNPYVYYVNRNHVIDAMGDAEALGRYANDANGMTKVKGITNNAEYTMSARQVFIKATRDILPGEEILVAYGKEYWDVVKI
jgi:SET domain-containing protein